MVGMADIVGGEHVSRLFCTVQAHPSIGQRILPRRVAGCSRGPCRSLRGSVVAVSFQCTQ